MADVVTIRGLEHRYDRTHALRGVDLTLGAGECLALLGPNGAGKTTLVGALTGTLVPTAGVVRVDGADPRRPATRRRLGVVHQQAGLPRTLTVRELVSGWAIRAGRAPSAAEPVLAELGLGDLAGRRATELSGGQQRRLQLAMALVVDPTLLVLDEPTVGLDTQARRRFWATLTERRDRGTAVLLTTHQIEEAAAVADRVVVLSDGYVIAEGSPTGLTAQLPDRTVTARTRVPESVLRTLRTVLAEDQGMVLGAFAALLALEPDIEIVATAADGDAALAAVLAARPDVLLTDIEMPGRSGLDVAAELARRGVATRVVIVTTFARSGYLRRALDAGVAGYVLKDAPVEQLVDTLRRVHAGQRVIAPELAVAAWDTGDPLTDRERDVLRAAADGSPNAEIAARLHLAEGTVRNYLSSAIAKLGARNRTEAAATARARGWL